MYSLSPASWWWKLKALRFLGMLKSRHRLVSNSFKISWLVFWGYLHCSMYCWIFLGLLYLQHWIYCKTYKYFLWEICSHISVFPPYYWMSSFAKNIPTRNLEELLVEIDSCPSKLVMFSVFFLIIFFIWNGVIADLKTMLKRVESEQYYVTLEMFIADAKRMFANARTYNSPETIYFKCATRHVVSLIPLTLHISSPFVLACEGQISRKVFS